jgi:hypothetical protein
MASMHMRVRLGVAMKDQKLMWQGVLRGLAMCWIGAYMAGPVYAKLPALSEEAKARAAETAARSAHANKVADFQLCKSRERTASHYFRNLKTQGKDAPTPTETAACTDPGPFVSVTPVAASAPAASTVAAAPGGASVAPTKKTP